MRQLLFAPLALLAGSLCAFGSVDAGLLGLVPSNAATVASFDVINSRNSEFGRYLLTKSQTDDSHFQELLDQTGFDPRRDLQSLVFATSELRAGSHRNSFVILARGSFDEQRIRAHAQAKGAVSQTYQGVSIMVNQSKNDQTAFAFLDTGVAALADVATLQQIIQNRSTPSTLDPALQSKINALGAKNDIWFAALTTGDFMTRHLDQAQGNAKVLQSVVQSSGGVKLGPTIDVTFHAVTRSPQDANSLADVIHFMASMVQMQRDSDKRANLVASSLDTMTVHTAGNEVHFAMSLPEKDLEQMAELAPKGKSRVKPNIQ